MEKIIEKLKSDVKAQLELGNYRIDEINFVIVEVDGLSVNMTRSPISDKTFISFTLNYEGEDELNQLVKEIDKTEKGRKQRQIAKLKAEITELEKQTR